MSSIRHDMRHWRGKEIKSKMPMSIRSPARMQLQPRPLSVNLWNDLGHITRINPKMKRHKPSHVDTIRKPPKMPVTFAISELPSRLVSQSEIHEQFEPQKISRKEEFQRNVVAFKELEKDPQYGGKYVVIYEGKNVASGTDRDKLLSDAYKKYGYVSLIVHKVGEKKVRRFYSPSRSRHA